jgi:hypothetical protein
MSPSAVSSLLRRLVESRHLALAPDALPRLAETAAPTAHLSPDRVRDMLLGLAIGDALGNTSEGLHPAERRQRFGRIAHYRPNAHAANEPLGCPSDDTRLAARTLEHLLRHDGLHPASLSHTFAARRIYGIGRATSKFQDARRRGVPWTRAGQPAAGNGVLMRIAAALPPHLRTGGRSKAAPRTSPACNMARSPTGRARRGALSTNMFVRPCAMARACSRHRRHETRGRTCSRRSPRC